MGKAVHAVLGTPLRSPLAQMRREQTPNFYWLSAHVLPRPVDWPDFCHVTGYWFLDTKPAWSPPIWSACTDTWHPTKTCGPGRKSIFWLRLAPS